MRDFHFIMEWNSLKISSLFVILIAWREFQQWLAARFIGYCKFINADIACVCHFCCDSFCSFYAVGLVSFDSISSNFTAMMFFILLCLHSHSEVFLVFQGSDVAMEFLCRFG